MLGDEFLAENAYPVVALGVAPFGVLAIPSGIVCYLDVSRFNLFVRFEH